MAVHAGALHGQKFIFPIRVKAFDRFLIFPIPGKFLDCDDYTKLNETKSSYVVFKGQRPKNMRACEYKSF